MEKVTFPEITEQPVMWGYYRDLHPAGRYKAIVDRDSGKLFSIVSKDYKVIRHEEAIDQIEEAIFQTPDFGEYKVTTEFFNDGGRMRQKYVFPDIFIEIAKNDVVNPELQLFNSYDTTWPLTVLLGAFRIVCTNGLVVGKKFLHLRKRHVYDFDRIKLHKQVSTALQRFELQGKEWKRWASRQLTKSIYTQVMTAMKFGKKATEEIKIRVAQEADEYDDDNDIPIMSLWIFFNILTWYISHRAVSLNHRVVMENRLRGTLIL